MKRGICFLASKAQYFLVAEGKTIYIWYECQFCSYGSFEQSHMCDKASGEMWF